MRAYTPAPSFVRIPPLQNGEMDQMTGNNELNLYNDNGVLKTNKSGVASAIAFNQSLNTTDAATFATVNTGQGANELYAMDQSVRTTDAVAFSTVAANSVLTTEISNNSGVTINVPATVASSEMVTTNHTQTLTNKTLTAPVMGTIKSSNTYSHAVPDTANDPFVTTTASQSLSNKTFTTYVDAQSGVVTQTIFRSLGDFAISVPSTSAVDEYALLTKPQTLLNKTINFGANIINAIYGEISYTASQTITGNAYNIMLFNTLDRSSGTTCSFGGTAATSYIQIDLTGWYDTCFCTYARSVVVYNGRYALCTDYLNPQSSTINNQGYDQGTPASARTFHVTQPCYLTAGTKLFVWVYPVTPSSTVIGHDTDSYARNRLRVVYLGS